MKMFRIGLFILLLLVAACQPTASTNLLPSEIPFPTMTIGQQLSGLLPTPGARPNLRPGEANPATAVALINRPTATPDMSTCPSRNDNIKLASLPDSRAGVIEAMLQFLNNGGSPEQLRDAMINEWDVFGDTGYLREEVDITGEDTPEIVAGYSAPGDVGTLLILGCQAGRYGQLYEIIADGIDPPTLIWLGDINNNPSAEVVFARRQCAVAEFCEFQDHIIAWQSSQSRFVNLLQVDLFTLEVPSMRDIDGDEVAELVVDLNSNGTAATGPLRSGVNIYDWNGQLYVLSIIQLNPPRYYIQIVHEGDKAFSNLEMDNAITLYELAINSDDFRYWFNDGSSTVTSYAYYRLILANAFLGRGAEVLAVLERMNLAFIPQEGQSLADLPVYVEMANRFVEILSQTNDLHESCSAVQEIIEERPSAVNLLNRYGTRSPQYDALQVCPF